MRVDAYNVHIIGNYLMVSSLWQLNEQLPIMSDEMWRRGEKIDLGRGNIEGKAPWRGGENVEDKDEEHDKIYFIYVYRWLSRCYNDNMIRDSFIYSGILTPSKSPVQGIWAETMWSAQNTPRDFYQRRFIGERNYATFELKNTTI